MLHLRNVFLEKTCLCRFFHLYCHFLCLTDMEIDPLEIAETAEATPHKKTYTWLNPAVAITIALLSTFMGVCKVKDDNIVQAMQQAQADKLDHWQFYQARNIREEVAKSTLVQLKLQALSAPSKLQPDYEAQIQKYEVIVKEQERKKLEIKADAEKDQSRYEELNFLDDQFDLSDASIAIAISLLAVAALTQLPWLYFLALFPSGLGIAFGLSAFLGWGMHPELLIKILS